MNSLRYDGASANVLHYDATKNRCWDLDEDRSGKVHGVVQPRIYEYITICNMSVELKMGNRPN